MSLVAIINAEMNKWCPEESHVAKVGRGESCAMESVGNEVGEGLGGVGADEDGGWLGQWKRLLT